MRCKIFSTVRYPVRASAKRCLWFYTPNPSKMKSFSIGFNKAFFKDKVITYTKSKYFSHSFLPASLQTSFY